jgi:hypothetical protein
MLTLASTFGAGRLELAARSLTTGFLSTLYPSSAAEGTTWLSGNPPAWLLGGNVYPLSGLKAKKGWQSGFGYIRGLWVLGSERSSGFDETRIDYTHLVSIDRSPLPENLTLLALT